MNEMLATLRVLLGGTDESQDALLRVLLSQGG